MTARRDRRWLAFAALAAMLLLVEWTVTQGAVFARGGAVPFAVLLDLVIVLPLLFAFLVLRPAKRPLVDATPVLTLGVLAAGVLLGARAETNPFVKAAGALAEAGVLALVVRRLRTGSRQLRGMAGDDFLLRVGALSDPMLRVAGVELATLYYAFVGPWRRRPLRPDELGYTEKSGLGGLLFALGFIVTMEGLAAHFVVHALSPRLSWVLAAINAYSLIWLAAAYQAAHLRPVALSEDRLLVRTSLLWTVDVPRAAIASVTRIHETPRYDGVLRAAVGVEPELCVTLTEPVRARGLLGIERSVTRIALYVDEPEKLLSALDDR